MIHVQGLLDDENGDENFQLNDQQKTATKNSIQLLINNNYDDTAMRSVTPVYNEDDINKRIADIHI